MLPVAVVTATSAVAADGGDDAARGSRLAGSANVTLTASSGPYEGDKIWLEFDARAQGSSGVATGWFRGKHRKPDGTVIGELEGYINCLTVSGTGNRTATATGAITKGTAAGGSSPIGMGASFTVEDRWAGDRLGWTWVPQGELLPPCQRRAVEMLPLDSGNYSVRR
nr:hypothetical protein GCM10020241_55060 [Streptoalloteichus tenebrarius]